MSVTDAAGGSVTASLLVAPPAGFVPADVALSLVGNPTHDEIVAQTRAALVRASLPLAAVRLSAQDSAPASGLHPGERLDRPVRVHLDGVGRYVDVDGIANVHIVVDAGAPVVPRTLFYSDDPEKIHDDGVLFSQTMSAAEPIRLFYYHQAATPGHEIAILLDAPTGSARVQVVGQGAGPNPAVMFVGQSATFRYLDAHARGSGVTLDVPVGAPVELFAGDRPMAAGDLVAGVLDISVLAGDPVRVSVVSLPEGAELRAFLGTGELPSDGKNRRGEYDLALASPLSLAFRAGDPEPDPVTVGALASALQNRRPGGHVLAGDYGLLRSLDFQLTNPLAVGATIYLYEQPIGYPVTTTIAFDGDSEPLRLQCVKNATTRYLVRAFSVAPGGTERITGNYMTDGGSTYPLTLGLTATEPSALPPSMTAPDGCYPKPVASESPAPEGSPFASPRPSPVSSASPTA